MKTKLLIIIVIIIFVAIYLPIHYYYPFLGIGSTTEVFVFCEEGYAEVNDECVPLRPSPLFPESIPESELNSEINIHCMTLEQSKSMAPFFKVPSYLPEDYSMKCSRSAMPSESYILYHNKDISDEWVGKIPMLIDEGAIFILQIDERTLVGEEKFVTVGTAEQRIQSTYDSVMESNPSLQPQLIRINGMLAYAVDSCPDCGINTADFPDGTSIQTSTSTQTRIKFIDENGIKYTLETTLPLNELILVAESLQ